jgi:NADH-quinone oxidoreductase subunit J
MYPFLFFVFAGAAVAFAVNLLVQRSPIYGALSLAGVMASLASLYLLLGAEFIAVAQVIISAGAIMFLFLTALISLNGEWEQHIHRRRLAGHIGAPLVVLLFGLLASVIYRQVPQDAVVRFGDFHGQTAGIGRQLFLYYMLPFELIPVLILVAIIGAVVLARKRT